MIEWVEARNGCMVPKINGVYLSSAIDPVLEGRKWAQSLNIISRNIDSVFIIGLGGGYHVCALSAILPDIEIIVLETNLDLVKQVASRKSKLGDNIRVVGVSSIATLMSDVFVSSALKSIYRVFVHPATVRVNSVAVNELEDFLLARNCEHIDFHLKCRSELKGIFENIPKNIKAKLTILDIERAIRSAKQSRQKPEMVMLALRELVK